MFGSLTKKLSSIVSKIKTKGVLKESDLEDAIKEVKVCLLESDVSLSVTNKLIEQIHEKATNTKKITNLMPVHILLKILKDEIIQILSSNHRDLSSTKGTSILMTGLQGSGKTTTCIKLAKHIEENHKLKTLVVSLDVYRPAAIEQLTIIAKSNNISVFETNSKKPKEILKAAIDYKNMHNYEVLIIDTAGRTQLDKEMMKEIKEIHEISDPTETVMVADSSSGQEISNIAKGFEEYIKITGIILSRADADNRGGAALSLSYDMKKPIFFLGTGEKASDLKEFHPTRLAEQILGQGDIISFVEKAMTNIEKEEQDKLEKKINQGKFDLEDMRTQFSVVNKIGGLSGIMNFMPGTVSITENKKQQTLVMMKKMNAILDSMTPKERANPNILSSSRKIRIAKGSGTTVTDVNALLKKYKDMTKMVKMFSGKGIHNFMNIMKGKQ